MIDSIKYLFEDLYIYFKETTLARIGLVVTLLLTILLSLGIYKQKHDIKIRQEEHNSLVSNYIIPYTEFTSEKEMKKYFKAYLNSDIISEALEIEDVIKRQHFLENKLIELNQYVPNKSENKYINNSLRLIRNNKRFNDLKDNHLFIYLPTYEINVFNEELDKLLLKYEDENVYIVNNLPKLKEYFDTIYVSAYLTEKGEPIYTNVIDEPIPNVFRLKNSKIVEETELIDQIGGIFNEK